MGHKSKSKPEGEASQAAAEVTAESGRAVSDAPSAAQLKYISPIASPLFDGKLLERSLKLIQRCAADEQSRRAAAKTRQEKVQGGKLLHRGVAEVTKALRKGDKGLVFFAADIFPEDIIAHIPCLCEEKGSCYGYLGSRQTLGTACKSARITSVIMISEAATKAPGVSEKTQELFQKVDAAARKVNIYCH